MSRKWETVDRLMHDLRFQDACVAATHLWRSKQMGPHDDVTRILSRLMPFLLWKHKQEWDSWIDTCPCIVCGTVFDVTQHFEYCCGVRCALLGKLAEECPSCANHGYVPYGGGPEPSGYVECPRGCSEDDWWVKAHQEERRVDISQQTDPLDDSDIPF